MAQLQEVPINISELTKDGKIYVTPTYETVARSTREAQHFVFSACGDGEKNFRIVTFGGVPTKEELEKAGQGGLVEIDPTQQNPTLINFNYQELGESKNQMALKLDNVKIK